jgi:hypothetical protein
MSSLHRRLAVRAFKLSYYVPFFGFLWRCSFEAMNRSRAIDVTLRDVSPRRRRILRELLRDGGLVEGSFDSRPEKPTLH